MNIPASAAVLMLLATPVAAQSNTPSSPQTPSAADLTRALNGAPPFVAPAPAPAPTPTPAPGPAPVLATPKPTPAPVPVPAAITVPVRTPAAEGRAATAAAARPSADATPDADVAAPATPATEMSSTSEPAAPAYHPLDATARAALPFRLDLPEGFDIGTGRPGPDFTIYSVRRGTTPFVMIYTGPASQFPIYDGQLAEVAGRASVVVTEPDGRHAMEHLFQRATTPREIHIWVTSLDGDDRALAERIAQSVDLR